MITRKDVNEEIQIARKVLEDDNADVNTKLKSVLKLVEVGIKIGCDNRVNLVKIMEHLEVPKVQPRKREDAKPKPEETTKE